jgi:predicted DNA-binding transcriptional regulator AlpA
MSKRTQETATQSVNPASLLRLKGVLTLVPIGASTWWKGVNEGKFPKPIRLGPNTTVWRARDILDLIERLGREDDAPREPAPPERGTR